MVRRGLITYTLQQLVCPNYSTSQNEREFQIKLIQIIMITLYCAKGAKKHAPALKINGDAKESVVAVVLLE